MLNPEFEQRYREIHRAHREAGIDHEAYQKYNFAFDQMLTYFYINGVNQGLVASNLRYFVSNKIDWRRIYTDKFVKCDTDDPGCVGTIHGQGYKDQYFDYSLLCLEFEHLDTFNQMRNMINELPSSNVYKLKPPTMMYLAGMVKYKNDTEKFKYCFNNFRKNLTFFENLS